MTAEEALQEIVVLCEPDRIPLPLINSRILRVARAALSREPADKKPYFCDPECLKSGNCSGYCGGDGDDVPGDVQTPEETT